MSEQHICTNCYFVGVGKKAGSGLLEFIGWISFILPGMAYGSWRRKHKHSVCPKCHERTMIPLDTPKGQELLQKTRPLGESIVPHNTNPTAVHTAHGVFIAERDDNKIKGVIGDVALVLLFILFLLLGFGSFSGQNWLSGIIFLAVSPLPFLRKRLPPPFDTRKVIGIAMVCVSFFAVGMSNNAADTAEAERIARLEATRQEIVTQAKTDFQTSPEKTIKEISDLIKAKDFSYAKAKAERLLDTNDAKIRELYETASSGLENARKAQRIEAEQKQKEAEAAQLTANWDVSRGQSEMDDTPSISVIRSANAAVAAWPRQVTPLLMIRCKESKTDVLFIAETSFTPILGEYNKAQIRVRIDEGKATPQLWGESTDGDAAFAPNPVSLLRQVQNASILRIEFNPFNSGLAIAEFDMRGVKPHLEEVAKVCGWKL